MELEPRRSPNVGTGLRSNKANVIQRGNNAYDYGMVLSIKSSIDT